MKTRCRRAIKDIALYSLAGPPIGGLAFLVWATLAGQPPLPFELSTWFFVMFPAAFMLGGVPALVTGMVAAYLRARSPSAVRARTAMRLLVPAVVGAISSVTLTVAEPGLLLASVGGLSAFLCALILDWRTSVRPNNSSKPTPLRGAA